MQYAFFYNAWVELAINLLCIKVYSIPAAMEDVSSEAFHENKVYQNPRVLSQLNSFSSVMLIQGVCKGDCQHISTCLNPVRF